MRSAMAPTEEVARERVSVIIRSMDRASLAEALESLAAQTYPPSEVIVVNAHGAPHAPCPDRCGSAALRFIDSEVRLGRSRAANVGLDHVSGRYVQFLDDDDWFAPEHIATLVDALQRHGARRAAYSGVMPRGKRGEALDLPAFNAPFDAARLRAQNYIPIHALMFEHTLCAQGLRFDEALDVYEDWDFLLQLTQHTEPLHVDRITAFYRAGGDSGVGLGGAAQDRQRGRQRIFAKWCRRWDGAQIDDMLGAAQAQSQGQLERARAALDEAHAALQAGQAVAEAQQRELDQAMRTVRTLQVEVQARQREADVANGKLYELLHSPSWRVTAPLRWAKRAARGLGRRAVGRALGFRPWQADGAGVTQGFAGEAIGSPPPLHERPLVSVIMPVYNACRSDERFLQRALGSVAEQSYTNFELIIVDDGSSDGTRALCEAFIAAHPKLRIRLLGKDNGGQSSARNFGVAASVGALIGFIDQDDEWYADKLERVVPWFADPRIDVLYTDADTIDGAGKLSHAAIHRSLGAGAPHPKRNVEDILFRDVFVMPGLMTIRREAFDRAGGFDPALSGYEDDDLFLRLFETGRIFYLPEPTLRWRMYEDNYSLSPRMLRSRLHFWRKLRTQYGAARARDSRRPLRRPIAQRFFWEFMNQAQLQFAAGNPTCWENYAGAREVAADFSPPVRGMLGVLFSLPGSWVLALLTRGRRLLGRTQ